MGLCLRSPDSDRLILWSISSDRVLPLSCYASLATSVLPATDVTSGKHSPTQEDRLYLAEFFSCLGKQTCSSRWVSRAFPNCFHCSSPPLSAQRLRRTNSEKSDLVTYLRCRLSLGVCSSSSTNHLFLQGCLI